MTKIVLTFGLIAGAIIAAMSAVTVPLAMNGAISMANSQILGFSIMILAFIAVFFGIRSYRDNVNRGAITFGRAFKVGILITLVACAVYVIGWEIVYWGFIPDFAERYEVAMINDMRAKGASAAEIAKTQADMAKFKVLYKNPFFNVGMTFLEIFPVGLIMTLVSAGILRRKSSPGAPVGAATTVLA